MLPSFGKEGLKMVWLLLSILLPIHSQAAGGDWIGNGGDLLRCWNKEKRAYDYELLDYYEGRTIRRLVPDLGAANLSFHDKVLFVIDRLAKVNPTRGALYRAWYETFFEETNFFIEGEFAAIPDTGPIVVPEGCKIRQFAAQLPDEQILPGDHRYTIDLKLWNEISEETRAGIVLHELVYREAILNSQMNSKRVRYFTQYISSGKIAQFTQLEMLGLVRTVNFRHVDYFGVPVDLGSARFYSSGGIQSAYATGGEWVKPGQAPLPLANRWVSFDEAGRIASVSDSSSTAPNP